MSELERLKSRFRRLAELRETADEASTAADQAQRDYREYEGQLREELSDAGIKRTLTFDFGPPLGEIAFTPRKPTIYGRILNDAAAREALEAEGRLEELTSPKFAAKRINELVRQKLEDGEPLPEGIDFYERSGITISKR